MVIKNVGDLAMSIEGIIKLLIVLYRPHGSLDYMAPVAVAAMCLEQGSAMLYFPQDRGNM